jgi:hypothetical protein
MIIAEQETKHATMSLSSITMTTAVPLDHTLEDSTANTLSLGIFPKRTKEEFKQCFGPKLAIKVGKYSLWDLNGSAASVWTRVLFPRAMDVLRVFPVDPRKCVTSDRMYYCINSWYYYQLICRTYTDLESGKVPHQVYMRGWLALTLIMHIQPW